MANRHFHKMQALEREMKKLYVKITIGATGAPTLVGRLGIATIARTGAGDYRLVLEDKYVSLRGFKGSLLDPLSEDIVFQLKAEDVDGAKTVDFFTNTAATATDPSNGATLLIELSLKNSGVK